MSEPLSNYLKAQGYQVNCEVGHCDMTARKDDELIIIELKLKMSLRFLYQGLQRKRLSDSIYLALPLIGATSSPPEFRNLRNLLKRLEMGLIFVRFLKTKTKVEIIQHPDKWDAPKRPSRRRQILREIDARGNEHNKAGSSGRTKKITAYRMRVLEIAKQMSNGEIWTPAQLKKIGCHRDTGSMLRLNHYGWFVREDRGKYRLESSGYKALEHFKEIVDS